MDGGNKHKTFKSTQRTITGEPLQMEYFCSTVLTPAAETRQVNTSSQCWLTKVCNTLQLDCAYSDCDKEGNDRKECKTCQSLKVRLAINGYLTKSAFNNRKQQIKRSSYNRIKSNFQKTINTPILFLRFGETSRVRIKCYIDGEVDRTNSFTRKEQQDFIRHVSLQTRGRSK